MRRVSMHRLSAITDSPATRSDAEPESLLEEAAAGNCAAFARLYDRFAPHVLGVIRRVLTDDKAGEQALEYVFMRLWRGAPQLVRARVSVAAWLVITARAYAIDQLRRRVRPPGRESQYATVGSLDASLAWVPDARAIGRLDERRLLLRKVLGQLPRPQLKSLELVVFSGRAEAELADDLGEPLARVKTELRAATRFLKHRRRAVVGSWTVDI